MCYKQFEYKLSTINIQNQDVKWTKKNILFQHVVLNRIPQRFGFSEPKSRSFRYPKDFLGKLFSAIFDISTDHVKPPEHTQLLSFP